VGKSCYVMLGQVKSGYVRLVHVKLVLVVSVNSRFGHIRSC
jgi:hypothetical protein